MKTLAVEFRVLFWAILGVIVPFGLLLFLFPGGTESYWAWVIPHPRSATLIGAAYVGATPYYLLALRENDWEQVRNGMGGLIVFSLVLLLATMLHWEAFKPYHVTTLVWLMFYYVGPFLIPIVGRLQARGAGPASSQVAIAPLGWRAWMALRAFLYLGLALLGLVFATSLVGAWPWSIAPLELRVFLGQVAIIGWTAAMAVRGGPFWRRNRLGMVLTGGIGLANLVGLLIGSTPYDGSATLGPVLPVIFIEWVVTPIAMYFIYGRR